jgi:hypothetical protein
VCHKVVIALTAAVLAATAGGCRSAALQQSERTRQDLIPAPGGANFSNWALAAPYIHADATQ